MPEKKRPEKAKPATKVTSIRLDPDLHRRARIYSLNQGVALQEVMALALDDYLKKKGA